MIAGWMGSWRVSFDASLRVARRVLIDRLFDARHPRTQKLFDTHCAKRLMAEYLGQIDACLKSSGGLLTQWGYPCVKSSIYHIVSW